MATWDFTKGLYDSFYIINEACPSNSTVWTDPVISHNVRVKAQHINELRAAINAEKTRRHLTTYNFGSNLVRGNIILKSHTKDLRDQIENMRSFNWTYDYSLIRLIDSGIISEVRSAINDLENDCLCNCNYCTCNCNYCTCNCNYCTCNCNYCTCNCNYSCTCNCNYSDKNLKEDIEYL